MKKQMKLAALTLALATAFTGFTVTMEAEAQSLALNSIDMWADAQTNLSSKPAFRNAPFRRPSPPPRIAPPPQGSRPAPEAKRPDPKPAPRAERPVPHPGPGPRHDGPRPDQRHGMMHQAPGPHHDNMRDQNPPPRPPVNFKSAETQETVDDIFPDGTLSDRTNSSDSAPFIKPENIVHGFKGTLVIEEGIIDNGAGKTVKISDMGYATSNHTGRIYHNVKNIETSMIKAENGGSVHFFDVGNLTVKGDVVVTGVKDAEQGATSQEVEIDDIFHSYKSANGVNIYGADSEKSEIIKSMVAHAEASFVTLQETPAMIGGNVIIDDGYLDINMSKNPFVIKGNVSLTGPMPSTDGIRNIASSGFSVGKASVIIEGDLTCSGLCHIFLGKDASIEVKGKFLPSTSTSIYVGKEEQECAGGTGVILSSKSAKS